MTRIASFLILFLGSALLGQAYAFDRIAAADQYQQWLVQLKKDIAIVEQQVPRDRAITTDDIARLCAGSIVPGSRGEQNLTEWLNLSRKSRPYTSSGEIVYAGPFVVLMRVFEWSVPAGSGGVFPEPANSVYPDLGLQVLYMHVHGGETLARYFDTAFHPYHLPPEGKVERDAYPFLLFEQKEGRLRFGGVGKEWWGVFSTAYDVQFH